VAAAGGLEWLEAVVWRFGGRRARAEGGVTITQARVQRLMLVDGVLLLVFSTLILALAAVPSTTCIA
jgi:hypothetical protein